MAKFPERLSYSKQIKSFKSGSRKNNFVFYCIYYFFLVNVLWKGKLFPRAISL